MKNCHALQLLQMSMKVMVMGKFLKSSSKKLEKLFNNLADEKMDIDEKLPCSSTSSDVNESNGDGEIFEEQLKEIRKIIQ
mmetsp:Transcript_29982/g.29688  ORF Transcript_29982/g.29688 Transcript_29982/m.29688 type:complete len:80 (+) Transcript_29982:45-284(+)